MQYTACKEHPNFFYLSIRHRFFKRLFDIFFSLIVLISLSPLYLLIALLVKCSSKGPIFYISRRIGRRGALIKCFKFRTMHPHADEELDKLLSSDPNFAQQWAIFHKLQNDPRVTAFGKILRKTSLDELPQFLNVLLGDLSVVGPRALHFTGSPDSYLFQMHLLYGDKASYILSMRPGITGIWQISGRSSLSLEQKNQLEINYATKQTFWQDMKVICKTIPAILSSKGAF